MTAGRGVLPTELTVDGIRKIALEEPERLSELFPSAPEILLAALGESERALKQCLVLERDRSEELSALLDAIPTPVFLAHDPESRHITGNRAADELVRNPKGAEASLSAPEAERPRHYRTVKDGRDLAATELPGHRAAQGVPVKGFEFRLVFDEGDILDVVGYANPLFDKEGRPRGSVVALVDLTERKRSEARILELNAELERKVEERTAELRRALAELNHAQEIGSIGSWAWEVGPNVVTWSDETCRIFGLDPGSVGGRPGLDEIVRKTVHPDDRQRVEAHARALGQTAKAGELEFRVVRPDGSMRHLVTILGDVEVGESGRAVRYFGVVQDITERKRVVNALRESEKRYRNLVEESVLFVNRYLPGGILTFVNRSLADFVGVEPEELLGKSFYPFLHEEDRERVVRAIESLSRESPVRTLEGRIAMPEGKTYWHQWTHSALFDDNGSLIEYQAVGNDITEQKRLQAEKERLDAQLRQAQKMEAIGVLAGGIAHDFNNILTPIIGHADLALRELEANHLAREDVQEIAVAAERAAALVRQILTISRRETGEPLAPVSLGPLVKEVAKLLRSALPTMIDIQVHVNPACGPVVGEVSQLHQVVMNLCTNAAYAMRSRGGVLSLSVESISDGRDRWVRLTVRDTGEGIPKEALPRIFEPYFTTKPAGQGSGLGLALAHGIVSRLGGTIRVESEAGKGSAFEVSLPESSQAETTPAQTIGEIPRGRGEHVLVVDDEGSILQVLRLMLTNLGYQVTQARSGDEALSLFGADPSRFHAVLTDFAMPRMSGLGLAQALLEMRSNLPIVLGTGFADGLDDRVVKEKGLRGLLMKPYTMRSVGEALAAALASPTPASRFKSGPS